MKSGNLNFLEPSRPLQVCNGTALPFILPNFREGGSHADVIDKPPLEWRHTFGSTNDSLLGFDNEQGHKFDTYVSE